MHTRTGIKEIPAKGNESILVSLEKAKLSVPNACRSGECAYCRSRLIKGDIWVSPYSDGRRVDDKHYDVFHPCASFPLSDIEMILPNIVEMLDQLLRYENHIWSECPICKTKCRSHRQFHYSDSYSRGETISFYGDENKVNLYERIYLSRNRELGVIRLSIDGHKVIEKILEPTKRKNLFNDNWKIKYEIPQVEIQSF